MASIREELAQDLAKAVPLYGQSFEWNGGSYPCVVRDQPTMSELQEEGGFIDGVSKAIVVAKSAFPDYAKGIFPQDNDPIDRRRYQIKKRNGHKDPAAAQLILYIGSFD